MKFDGMSNHRFRTRSLLTNGAAAHSRTGPPVASSAHFSRTLSPTKLHSDTDSPGVESQMSRGPSLSSVTTPDAHSQLMDIFNTGSNLRYNSLSRESVDSRSFTSSRPQRGSFQDSNLSTRNRFIQMHYIQLIQILVEIVANVSFQKHGSAFTKRL